MVKSIAVDLREFGRFMVTGITGTVGNVVAVWMACRSISFESALFVGIAIGAMISFMMSKLFVFGSRSWERAGGEAARFLVVYTTGCAVYWVIAFVMGRFVLIHSFPPVTAEMVGALIGAGTMGLTSYLGHRFFTYRTFERATRTS